MRKTGATKVGVIGSSAGGHLASTAATHYTSDSRPDFQILFYPVITMDATYTQQGSRENLLGKNPSQDLVDLYSNEKQVTADTPPAFIMGSTDDDTEPVRNFTNYDLALLDHGVPQPCICILMAATVGDSRIPSSSSNSGLPSLMNG